ncbi:FAD/NAD(P)-binding protein [Paenibacillus sp. MDMC362]|uniref:FAD/NAD(P)-binding protein n=1 Tax=Paenibacillus sp. MDMC362 TaxID=2977365 RepID=UPI000DC5F023|nr:FAD/NAD(P)-binding protein [Paenibacillus sp. MDMC362]RAR40637.1 hypothetical protein DP091_27580 [Paenibacillus sp. MDMC362]
MPALELVEPLQNTSGTYSVAVVGGGSATVSFVKSLVNRVMDQKIKKVKLTIFEKGNIAGPGLPYQDDFDCIRINVPAQAMSICSRNAKDFEEWLYHKKEYWRLYMESEFLPRRVFGEYLSETLYSTIERGKDYIPCEIIFKKVIDIHKRDNGRYEIITEDGQRFDYNFVLLAIGVMKPDDHYQLMGESGYIHCPYPAKRTLKNIEKKETVTMIGSGLAAVDMALALRFKGHEGKIFMVSRNGKLPAIRGQDGPYKTKFYTSDNLNCSLEKDGYVGLRHAVRLLRKEFKAAELDWREILFNKAERHDHLESFRAKLNESVTENPWYEILCEIHAVTNRFWKDVPGEHKQIFIQKYQSAYINKKAPIPLINASQIYSLLRSKQLQILGGIQSIQKREREFYVKLQNHQQITCDHIINTTGPSMDVSKNGLLKKLLARGYVTEDINGGIRVDFESGSVISKDDRVNSTLCAIGHIANGTYFFINSLELIVYLADSIAERCVTLLTESTL